MKTTKKQYQYFCKRLDYWQKTFGIGNWDIETGHEKLDKEKYATTTFSTSAMNAYIRFNTEVNIKAWSDSKIDKTACHEILHLVLGQLDSLASEFCSDYQVGKAVHAAIFNIQKALF